MGDKDSGMRATLEYCGDPYLPPTMTVYKDGNRYWSKPRILRTCLRCCYKWFQFIVEINPDGPKQCPECHSSSWDKYRKRP